MELEHQPLRKLKISLLCSIIFLGILYFSIIIIKDNPSNFPLGYQTIEGRIKQIIIDGDSLQITIDTSNGVIQGFYTISSEKEKDNLLKWQLGDVIRVSGEVAIPSDSTIFNGFSYRHYLYSKKIYHIITIDIIEKVKNNQNLFYHLKNTMLKRIQKSTNAKYLRTFLLGDKTLLEEDIIESYQKNGVSHLFAVSGMHISLFVAILSWVFQKFKHRHLILSIFLCFYVFLTGFTPSIIRATILFICSSNKRKPIFVLIILSFILILYNPFIIYDTGFLFSFIISGYLLLFGRKMETIQNPILRLWMVSFFCFVVSIPISIISFHEIYWFSSIFNIFFVPLVSYLVFPFAILTFIFPFLDIILGIVIILMEKMSYFCNIISISTSMYNISIVIFFLYYVLITLTLIKPKVSILLCLLLTIHIFYKNLDNHNYITMLDVGQGDSILLELSNNRNILVDTGGILSYEKEEWQIRKKETNIAKNKIIPYLKSRGIGKLDALVLTHGDVDHLGETMHLLERFKVKQVIMNSGHNNSYENKIIEYCKKHKIAYQQISRKTIQIADQTLSFLNDKDSENENEDSLIFYTNLDNKNILFMGDAGHLSENTLLDVYNLPKMDILKVGHHGSRNSSSEKFINQINPTVALISAGKNNRYKHPHEEVLEILDSMNAKTYVTSEVGSIRMDLNSNTILTCP